MTALNMEANADGGIVAEVQSRHGHSAQPESQQVVAVLRAVLEVIQAEAMSATPTTIFAAIMSVLEKPETQRAPQVQLEHGGPYSKRSNY
jgi:ribosomal RNA-processing protein 12